MAAAVIARAGDDMMNNIYRAVVRSRSSQPTTAAPALLVEGLLLVYSISSRRSDCALGVAFLSRTQATNASRQAGRRERDGAVES